MKRDETEKKPMISHDNRNNPKGYNDEKNENNQQILPYIVIFDHINQHASTFYGWYTRKVYNSTENKVRERETKNAQTNIWIYFFFCIKNLTPLKLFNLSTRPFLPSQINISMVFKLVKDTLIPQN